MKTTMEKQELTKKFKKYVVFWNPLNRQQATVNYLCYARNPQDAINKARKTTRSKAKMYVTEYKPQK